MNWDQLISGMGYGLWAVGIAGIGRVVYVGGSKRMGSHSSGAVLRLNSMPFVKCVLEGIVIAVVIGAIASSPTVIREGGDYLNDPGEIVEVVEEKSPMSSFARVFVFVSVCWIVGAARNDAE